MEDDMTYFTKKVQCESFIKFTLFQVAQGLRQMHRNNVLHRDLKIDNILFNS